MLLSIPLTLGEMIILQVALIVLGAAVYFVIISRRSLKKYMPQGKVPAPAGSKTVVKGSQTVTAAPPETASARLQELEQRMLALRQATPASGPAREGLPGFVPAAPAPPPVEDRDALIDTLRATIAGQQDTLNGFLTQINELESSGQEALKKENDELQEVIVRLEGRLEKKDDELDALRQQARMVGEMTGRIEEVYQEFDLLQRKMAVLEQQAADAGNLAMELEDVKTETDGLRQELHRKGDKLDEVINENTRLRHVLAETEDKLAESNAQRQGLLKKVQFLQDLNDDLHNISETNKKLQSELRRIGELESMLNLLTEEKKRK